MAVIISVVSGGAVVGAQRIGPAKNGVSHIKAVEGARYVFADTLGGGAPAGVTVKRAGKNLVVAHDVGDVEQGELVIEDFYGSGAELVSQGADGSYRALVAYTENGAVDAADLGDGVPSLLAVVSAQAAPAPASFQFTEGGSSAFSGGLASMAAVAGAFALGNGGGSSNATPVQVARGAGPEGGPIDAVLGESMPSQAAEENLMAAEEKVTGDSAIPESVVSLQENDAGVILGSVAADTTSRTLPEVINTDGVLQTAGALAARSADNTPVIDAVLDDQGLIQGVVENGGYTDDGRPQIVGKAEAGVLVHIYRGVELIGQVYAGADGEWSFTPKLPLSDGRHVITILHEYLDGDVSEISDPYVIFVDKSVPDAPVIIGMQDDEGRITGAISEGMITDDNRPTIDGTAEAHATVVVYDKGKEIGRTSVGADGTWRFIPEPALADGYHMLSYAAVDRAGNGSERTAVSEFVVDTRAEKITIYYANDDVGSVTGEVFSGGITDDTTPMLFGSATAGGLVKIYEGEVLIGEVAAGVDGIWYFTPEVALSKGAHTFHATVTLVAKGESDRSKPFVLNVDATPVERPSIDQVLDDVGDVQGALENGQSTDDSTPTLVGKAPVGSIVHIYEGSNPLGSVLADDNGNWRYTVTTPLVDGMHTFTVKAESKTGNFSEVSNAYGINVDTVAPTQIASVSNIGKDSGFNAHDSLTNDGSAGRLMTGALSVQLAAGERLEVSTDGGKSWVNALVEGNQWSAQDGSSHMDSWTIQTRVIDAAGNIGPVNSHAVVLDTVAPKAPTGLLIEGLTVTVAFDRTNLVAGDKLYLTNAGQSFVYQLTAADIAAGKVTSTPGIPLSESLTAAIVNQVGNKSAGLSTKLTMVGQSVLEDRSYEMDVGESLDFQHFTASNISGGRIRDVYMQQPGTTTHGFYTSGNSVLKLDLKNPVKYVTFWAGTGSSAISGWYSVFNQDGVLIQKVKIPAIASWPGRQVEYTAPAGESISSIVFEIATYNVWLNHFGFNSYVSTYITSELVNQDVTGLHFGGAEDNVFSIADVGKLSGADAGVHGGLGLDTLKLTGANQTLDLTALGRKISSVEIIDITGTGNNVLKLSLNDVLENGGFNQFVKNDRVQMMVKGNAGDSVTLSDLLVEGGDQGDWIQKVSVVIDGMAYTSYQHSSLGAELLVQQGVAVVLDNHEPGGAYSASYSDGSYINVEKGGAVSAGPGDDTVHITSTDFTLLDGGLGIDTLVMDGQSMHIDLSEMGAKVQGFERFDLGAGGNQLSLGISDLLAAGAQDLLTSNGRLQLVVNGSDGEVNLHGNGNDWMTGGMVSVGGVSYDVFSNLAGTAELLVEEGIQVWGMVLQVHGAYSSHGAGADLLAAQDQRLEAY